MVLEIIGRWDGAFAVEGDRVIREERAPEDDLNQLDRLRLRRDGHRTPEEDRILGETSGTERFTRDRRLAIPGISLPTREQRVRSWPPELQRSGARQRELLLAFAQEAIADAWDPTVPLDEAVRAMADLDEVHNLLSERLESWARREAPGIEGFEAPEGAADATKPAGGSRVAVDPALAEARGRISVLLDRAEDARSDLERTIERALPDLAPNLSALLGPMLAARMISQAGGLARLARLPSSTIQVLGAERAFFAHLRGRAPPPRHGLLFLHPHVQGAPRSARGKLARTLAGKTAIAARLDRAGRPVDPRLADAFEQRRAAIRQFPTNRRAPRPPNE
ncbi:MAG: hypothetical protein WCA77_01425 [Thermoplasmata archaeon]